MREDVYQETERVRNTGFNNLYVFLGGEYHKWLDLILPRWNMNVHLYKDYVDGIFRRKN